MKTCYTEARANVRIMLHIVACLIVFSKSVSCEVFTNSFLVKLHGEPGNEVANQIALRNGFENVGPVSHSHRLFSSLSFYLLMIIFNKEPYVNLFTLEAPQLCIVIETNKVIYF